MGSSVFVAPISSLKMLKYTNIIIVILALGTFYQNAHSVQTPLGKISGQLKTSHNGRKFLAFEGIPYAKPPIRERRFEEPEAIESWNDTWDANFLRECAQTDMSQPNVTKGDEDCLYINVYVPREEPNPEEKLEVVVYIHGGAFMYGSGHGHSPPYFAMDKELIYVSFNYRLGIFGFLSTEDDVVPGNNGLKDQAMALKWVQQNIASFGGNPESITLTGISAGGASVHLHYFSDISENLFHRGISHSGVALNPWVLAEEPLDKAKKLADSLGCPTDSTRALVDCLKKRPYKQILSKMELFFSYKSIPFTPFGPVIEKEGSKPFLKANPYDLLKNGQVHSIPWMASVDSHEGLFPLILFLEDLDYINEKWNDLAPFLLDFSYTLPQSLWKSTAQKIRHYYMEKEKIGRENLLKVVQIFSDRLFLSDAETAVRLQAKVTDAPVYFYVFGYPGDYNDDKFVMHGSEMKYLFGNTYTSVLLTSDELQMKDAIWDMLISYAKGNPSFKGVEWTQTKYDTLTYLNVTGFEPEDIKLQTTKELTRRKFWNGLRFTENENKHVSIVKDEL